ncbi:G-type lectin S-receptor-like serine/threonine-protein kinase [Platanthera zijinensis]|uniref:Receptor-like serine/threonine-protein kinase n=1 Tax=Platanthera zijinensis TaxID=2320716 RepID=A0AAP0B0W5_9ASPA
MGPYKRRLILLLSFLLHLRRAVTARIAVEFLYPNFTGSNFNYIENGGIFLTSASSNFSAIFSTESPQSPFVFSIIHAPTTTTVWSANAASPAPYTSALSLSAAGLSISLSNGSLLWSTPVLTSPVAALQLLDSGNLLLRNSSNTSLWQSFEHPTDTLLSSQRLPAGASLTTPAGDYRLLITAQDAVLLWTNGSQQYWRLSSDPRWVKDLNDPVAYMATNASGIYLFSAAGKAQYVFNLPPTVIRFVRLESGGRLQVRGYSGNGSVLSEDLAAPTGACDLPLSCTELQVCTMQNSGATCNCPPLFAPSNTGGCSPADGSTLVSVANCAGAGGAKGTSEPPSYKNMGSKVDYFANKFASPDGSNGNLSSCRDLCSGMCSCLGFFYQISSRACFLMKSRLGSLVSTNNQGVFNSGEGYIKVLDFRQPLHHDSDIGPNFIQIILPAIAGLFLILLVAGIYWWRRRQWSGENKLAPLKEVYPSSPLASDHDSSRDFSSSGDYQNSGEVLIPGLPHRFTLTELVAATNNFSMKIGAGGFGEVFHGELPDKTAVAVKRINAGLGSIQGKKEFCTEIGVIGRIHHVNLVRLRGFCAEGRRRRRRQHFLVYEYMNRGSLERSLFRASGPVLEWKERMSIAIGAARGLAYLHSGCDPKIVHCDVKPENILLDDGGGVKISDFGLSKLIAPERSGLFFTTLRGTRGYLAPEWLANSPISERADVYSYGMVLLEIIRGRKNYLEDGGGSCEGLSSGGVSGGGWTEYFPATALEMHEQGSYAGLADPRLEGRVREEEVGRAVRVALCCLHEDPALRPRMAAVSEMLDGTMEAAWPRPEALTFFRMFGKGYVDSVTSSGSGNKSSSSMGIVSWSDILMTRQRMAEDGAKGFNSLR